MPQKSGKKQPKKQKYKRLTDEQWSAARALWESGKFTIVSISEQYGITPRTIINRKLKENWEVKALAPAIEERIRRSTVEMLARLGMPKEEWLRLIVEGARETRKALNVKKVVRNQDNSVKTWHGRPITYEETISAVDNEVTRKYREDIGKIAGWFAPPKMPIEISADEIPETETDPLDTLPVESLEKIEAIIEASGG